MEREFAGGEGTRQRRIEADQGMHELHQERQGRKGLAIRSDPTLRNEGEGWEPNLKLKTTRAPSLPGRGFVVPGEPDRTRLGP